MLSIVGCGDNAESFTEDNNAKSSASNNNAKSSASNNNAKSFASNNNAKSFTSNNNVAILKVDNVKQIARSLIADNVDKSEAVRKSVSESKDDNNTWKFSASVISGPCGCPDFDNCNLPANLQ
jgi:hypothetical protein